MTTERELLYLQGEHYLSAALKAMKADAGMLIVVGEGEDEESRLTAVCVGVPTYEFIRMMADTMAALIHDEIKPEDYDDVTIGIAQEIRERIAKKVASEEPSSVVKHAK